MSSPFQRSSRTPSRAAQVGSDTEAEDAAFEAAWLDAAADEVLFAGPTRATPRRALQFRLS